METKPARPYLPINGNGELQPDAERRTPNPRHRHRRPQKRTLTTKNGREKTVRFLFHYLQLFFTFSIPPNPPSSHFFPFISSFLYIYLIGFHEGPSPQIVQSARNQIGKTLRYDPAYTKLKYPMGDVPMEKGVCTDVVIRALRDQNIDLQELVHQDMSRNFSVYPKRWGLKQPDTNIDHRREPNLMTYFTRQGWAVQDTNYQAGDIVTWELKGNRPHIGIVSDRKIGDRPLIIHNIGSGTREDDVLYRYTITGHYRLPVR